MLDFFEEQFELDFQENKRWIDKLIEQEEQLDSKEIKLLSHVLNHHHIWNARLNGQLPDSELWDVLPMDYWHSFNHQNYLTTKLTMNDSEFSFTHNSSCEEITEMPQKAADILQHILKHSVYHRGQIAFSLKMAGRKAPSMEFVSLTNKNRI